jgi:hypothetical protein
MMSGHPFGAAVGQPPAVGGGHPGTKADAGLGYRDVRRLVDQSCGIAVQFIIVGQCAHVDRSGAADRGALAAQ